MTTKIPTTMQALMFTDINKHKLVDMPVPTLTADDDVLLKVRSAGVCGSDLHGFNGQSGRRTPPLIMGHEVTAEVVAVGAGVENVSLGSRVAVQPVRFCGRCAMCQAGQANLCENRSLMGMHAPGAFAPFVKWTAPNLFPLPNSLSFEVGALAEPLAVTVHAVSLPHIRPYDTAFIAGAGPIGLLTLAVLRQTGVSRIAVSDLSSARLDIAKAIGADVVINPAEQDAREVVNAFTDGRGVDIAFEAVGIAATAQQTLDVTRNKGTVIWIGNNHKMITIDMQAIVTRELNVLGTYGMSGAEFQRSLQMLADGLIPSDLLINRRASLSEGESLFEELLAAPDIIKCLINFD